MPNRTTALKIVVGSHVLLFLLRVMIHFIPETGFRINAFGRSIMCSSETIILALWCLWLPLLGISLFLLYTPATGGFQPKAAGLLGGRFVSNPIDPGPEKSLP